MRAHANGPSPLHPRVLMQLGLPGASPCVSSSSCHQPASLRLGHLPSPSHTCPAGDRGWRRLVRGQTATLLKGSC